MSSGILLICRSDLVDLGGGPEIPKFEQATHPSPPHEAEATDWRLKVLRIGRSLHIRGTFQSLLIGPLSPQGFHFLGQFIK